MNKNFEALVHLPHSDSEEKWLRQRLETLSAKESIILTAALSRHVPETAAEAVNLLLALPSHEVYCPVANYEELGRRYLYETNARLPESVQKYTDMEALGRLFAEKTPGLFSNGCYVSWPDRPLSERYDGQNLDALGDRYALMVKLASQTHPEGVWMGLPDTAYLEGGPPDEIGMALRALEVHNENECRVLETRCNAAQVTAVLDFAKIPAQYDSIEDFLYDANNLSFLLDERGGGIADFEQRLAAALEYEDCQTLADVLEVGQYLGNYAVVPVKDVRDFARKELEKSGISPEIQSAVSLDAYGRELLSERGYTLACGESVFIKCSDQTAEQSVSRKRTPEKSKKAVPAR